MTMRNKYLYKTFLIGLFSFAVVACEDKIDPVITEINFDRVWSPTGFNGAIRNKTTIELTWNVGEGVDHYVVEFSEGSLDFTTIIRTVEVAPDELPLQETFFGDTQYSARVKAVSSVEGVGDSKWLALTIRTQPEDIFLPVVPSTDMGVTQATLKWPDNEQATRFVINPGNITRNITAGEVAAGEAIITGLNSYTNYTVVMYANNSQRGDTEFKTLMNPDCATCVKLNPGDDISNAIDAAADGSTIVLAPGTYPDEGTITVGKSITIQGELYYNQPTVYGQFACASAVTSISFIDSKFQSDPGAPLNQFFNTVVGCNLTTLNIQGCEISNYVNNFIYNNAAGTSYGSINVSNTYVHDIAGTGGDGIDFRVGTIGSLIVLNSTFSTGFRTFLRMQVACNVSFESVTFYKVCIGTIDGNNAGIFRVNNASSTFEVSNCLFVETGRSDAATAVNGGVWCRSNNMGVAAPIYLNNNIYSCYNIYAGLYTTAAAVSATEINPGFVNAAGGNFTVTNQAIIDNEIGDPRWRP